jgi:hypothetical protein
MATFSQSSNQKSRGMIALCSLGVPRRWLQRLNLLKAIPSQATRRTTESPVQLAQYRTNRTIASRVSWGTHRPFRVPQVLFLV